MEKLLPPIYSLLKREKEDKVRRKKLRIKKPENSMPSIPNVTFKYEDLYLKYRRENEEFERAKKSLNNSKSIKSRNNLTYSNKNHTSTNLVTPVTSNFDRLLQSSSKNIEHVPKTKPRNRTSVENSDKKRDQTLRVSNKELPRVPSKNELKNSKNHSEEEKEDLIPKIDINRKRQSMNKISSLLEANATNNKRSTVNFLDERQNSKYPSMINYGSSKDVFRFNQNQALNLISNAKPKRRRSSKRQSNTSIKPLSPAVENPPKKPQETKKRRSFFCCF